MKKVCSLFIALCLVFIMGIPAFAFSSETSNTSSLNEYENLMSKKRTAEIVLADVNSSEEERAAAQEILDFDPAQRVYELQEKSVDELRTMGFSDERVEIIKNFDGDSADLQRLAATVNVYFDNIHYEMVGEERWAWAKMSWLWNELPIYTSYDTAVVAGSSTFTAERDDSYCKVYYTADGATGSTDFTETYTEEDLVISPMNATNAGFYFPVVIPDTRPDGMTILYYSKSGTAEVGVMSVDDRKVTLSIGYGHATRNVSVSVGISWGASLGVSAGICLSEETYDVTAKSADSYTFPF